MRAIVGHHVLALLGQRDGGALAFPVAAFAVALFVAPILGVERVERIADVYVCADSHRSPLSVARTIRGECSAGW